MTCQFCQTWNTDEEHRCRRCGRRLNSASTRISPDTYPIAATARAQIFDTATAPALTMTSPGEVRPEPKPERRAERVQPGQPLLFDVPAESRVVSVDSMRSPIEREAIRARAAEASRPAPPKVERVEVSPRQGRRATAPRSQKPRTGDQNQQRFEFTHQQVARIAPRPTIGCEAPVAPVGMRIYASAIDGLIMVAGWAAALTPVLYFGGPLAFDRTTGLWLAVLFAVVSLAYRLMWIVSKQDSIGMQVARIRLVDFDGNRPRPSARYHRLIGGLISVLPAGLGLLWTFVDEDGLMWQDHISSTFPSLAE
jgi:uncharacterized RDD family membrane protein YckC